MQAVPSSPTMIFRTTIIVPVNSIMILFLIAIIITHLFHHCSNSALPQVAILSNWPIHRLFHISNRYGGLFFWIKWRKGKGKEKNRSDRQCQVCKPTETFYQYFMFACWTVQSVREFGFNIPQTLHPCFGYFNIAIYEPMAVWWGLLWNVIDGVLVDWLPKIMTTWVIISQIPQPPSVKLVGEPD